MRWGGVSLRCSAALAAACARGAVPITGQVLADGAPLADRVVTLGAEVARTDGAGRFAFDVAGDGPVTAVVSAAEAFTDLSCDSPHVVDASAPTARATAPLTLRLRGLTRPPAGVEPTFALHLTTLEGSERAPTQARWDIEIEEVVLTEGGDAWLRAEIPVARGWALGLSTLTPRDATPDAARSVDQVLLVTGGETRAGEPVALDVFLSDETLRGVMAWDASGPPGVASVEIVQSVLFGDLGVEVTTWRGPVAGPMILPVIRRVPDDRIEGVRGVFRYGPAGRCASRAVGMTGEIGAGGIEGAVDTGGWVGEALRFVGPFPPPPVLEMEAGSSPSWSMASFPLEGAALRFAWSDASVTWRGAGRTGLGGCRQVSLAWPPELAARRGELVGEVAWEQADRWGRCDLVAR
jgi:hypothetical protein